EEVLDCTVLERVEGDDHCQAVVGEERRELGEVKIELPQLVVHRHAQRLERTGRRMNGVTATRHDASDQIGERSSGRWPVGLDGAGDPPRVTLFTELEDDIRQRVVIQTVDEIERGLAACRVHAHVERGIDAKGKSTNPTVELMRGDAEIDEAHVDASNAE